MKKIIKRIIIIIIFISVLFTSSFIVNRIQSNKYNLTKIEIGSIPNPVSKVEDNYIELSNISMHYEKYGEEGIELILLHGNGGSCDTLRELATYLGNEYQVYLIESRCHGQSSKTDTISYIEMANDTYEFITNMNLDKPIFVGHSDGGMVGLALASMYPDSISTLISCGSNSNPKTFKFYFKAFVWITDLFNPSILNKMMLEQPNYTEEFLSNIKCRTLIVAAEHDIMWLSDSVYIYESIDNSEIMIMKDEDHCSYIEYDGVKGYTFIKEYLDNIYNKK